MSLTSDTPLNSISKGSGSGRFDILERDLFGLRELDKNLEAFFFLAGSSLVIGEVAVSSI